MRVIRHDDEAYHRSGITDGADLRTAGSHRCPVAVEVLEEMTEGRDVGRSWILGMSSFGTTAGISRPSSSRSTSQSVRRSKPRSPIRADQNVASDDTALVEGNHHFPVRSGHIGATRAERRAHGVDPSQVVNSPGLLGPAERSRIRARVRPSPMPYCKAATL